MECEPYVFSLLVFLNLAWIRIRRNYTQPGGSGSGSETLLLIKPKILLHIRNKLQYIQHTFKLDNFHILLDITNILTI